MEMNEIDRRIEVYLIMKIREFKDMIEEDPGDEDLPEGLRTFKNLQRIIMVGGRGPERRKRVIDHLRCLGQCIFHGGDESMDIPLGELNTQMVGRRLIMGHRCHQIQVKRPDFTEKMRAMKRCHQEQKKAGLAEWKKQWKSLNLRAE